MLKPLICFRSATYLWHDWVSSNKDLMQMKFRASLALIIFALVALSHAQDHAFPAPVALTVPDADVVNQSGQHLRFNRDVIRGRVAIITGFFTTCTSMCPITQENLSRVAKLLGDRMGKDVVIVSVSVDANNDTPERMKSWGEKFHIGPGWTLVSGNKQEVDGLLRSLGLYVEIPQRHQSAIIIGNEKAGWTRASSWASPEKVVKLIDDLERPKSQAVSASGSPFRK
jgi:protein SCO1